MLRIELRQEPQDFDERVRKPGLKAIKQRRDPLPPYWRECADQLRHEYKEICAYSCLRIPKVVGSSTVEHIAPKSKHLDLAYEWSNYRLVCGLMNSRKNHFEDVLDPFEIQDDWFELEFVFFQLKPAEYLADQETIRAIKETIDRLKLNDEECRTDREERYEEWRKDEVSDRYMERHAPFIYREAVRQSMKPLAP
jgi:hypothetical protein